MSTDYATMIEPWTTAELKRAGEAGRGQTVAARSFGPFGRFCAKLVKTREGVPHVFVSDAETIGDFGLPVTVWQGLVSDQCVGIKKALAIVENIGPAF